MALTNVHGLPQPLMNLFGKEKYTKGDAHVSVTELIGPPRISVLKARHANEINEDLVDRFWALIGTNIHRILEHGADAEHITEERLYVDVDGWRVSGGIDVQRHRDGQIDIIDWKFVSVMSAKSPKKDWEAQLNCYAWLIKEAKGIDVGNLQVCAILRDWQRSKASTDPSYPQVPIITIDLPRWSHADRAAFVELRVAQHKESRRSHDWGEGLPECTPEEMWLREGRWAVIKDGGQKASRTFQTREEAEGYVSEAQGKKTAKGTFLIEERPGSRVRCEGNYCGVSEFCDQWRRYGEQQGAGDLSTDYAVNK